MLPYFSPSLSSPRAFGYCHRKSNTLRAPVQLVAVGGETPAALDSSSLMIRVASFGPFFEAVMMGAGTKGEGGEGFIFFNSDSHLAGDLERSGGLDGRSNAQQTLNAPTYLGDSNRSPNGGARADSGVAAPSANTAPGNNNNDDDDDDGANPKGKRTTRFRGVDIDRTTIANMSRSDLVSVRLRVLSL